MARDAAYIRDNPNATGDCDWQDIRDNWRDADATWLQERGIVRVTTTPSAEAALVNTSEGRVFYSTTNKMLYLSTTGIAPFKQVLASTTLVAEDSAGSAVIGVDGHESSGISFNTTNGRVTIGHLTATVFTTATFTISTLTVGTAATVNGSLTVNSGSNPVVMTTAVGGLLVDDGMVVSGDLTVQDATATTLAVSGNSALNDTVVDGTLTVNDELTTPLLRAPGAEDLTIAVLSGQEIHFTSETPADAKYSYGDGTAKLAWVVVSATEPNVALLPEGTFWIQP